MLESAVFWGAGGALAWGFSDFIARFAGRSVGAMAATFAMMLIGAALMPIAMVALGESFDWRPDGLHWLGGIGAGVAVASMLFFYAVTHGPVSLAAPVVASYPAIAVPISVALGARPDPISWGAMAATLAGIWVVSRATSSESGDGAKPEYAPAVIRRTIILSLAAAAIYAASITAADRAIEIYGPWQTVLVIRLMGAFIVGVVVLVGREKARFPRRAWPILVSFGVLDTLGHLLLYVGLGKEHGEYAIVASAAYVVVTVVLARLFLREPVSILQWSGVALVVGGVGTLAALG
jgi:drug/metabolite transporter (DMT)-like permease